MNRIVIAPENAPLPAGLRRSKAANDALARPTGAVPVGVVVKFEDHTDAFVASETGTELAIRRAVEVRNLLISLKVEPERIRLFYRGAGNFVANNSTPEGKAINRRVEIELRKF